MPSRNTVKQYVEGGYYHIYNRGVEKRKIFIDATDYRIFQSILATYLSPGQGRTLNGSIELWAYCLMPNHYHLLLKQHSSIAITQLIRRVMTTYVIYFNRKYHRVGPLFQGKYKGVLIQNDAQLQHLSRYIHRNPSKLTKNLGRYPYSSYRHYISGRGPTWLYTEDLLTTFGKKENYKAFVEEWDQGPTLISSSASENDISSARRGRSHLRSK